MTESAREPEAPGDEAAPGTPSTAEDVCPRCCGSGRAEGGECPDCRGTGRVVEGVGGG
jgi:DnaJ-class molecular chaperone